MEKVPPYVIKTTGSTKLNPKLLNIDGSEDPFYRYKMRQLYVQVVGKGKMIKMFLLNIDDVSKDLKVSPAHLTAYMGYEIGAQYKYDSKKPEREKGSISGDKDANELSAIMKKFITDFVLCPVCHLPETTMKISKEGAEAVMVSCRSCPNTSVLNLRPKFQQFIVNHPNLIPQQPKEERAARRKQPSTTETESSETKDGSQKAEEEEQNKSAANGSSPADKQKREKKPKKKRQDEEEEDDVEWSCDTSAEAVRQRRHDLLPDRIKQLVLSEANEKEAAAHLELILTSNTTNPEAKSAPVVSNEIVKEIEALQSKYSFPNDKTLDLFFEALPQSINDILPYKSVFKLLVDDTTLQQHLLKKIEERVAKDNSKKLPFLLKQLYDDDILTEESILAWKPSSSVQQAAKPFVDWLRTAEEESDSE